MAIITGFFWELLILFFIVFIHEMGHAAAASHFGWRIKRILILPFGGFCEVDEHGNREMKEELIVVLAGPFQHLLIAILTPILVMSSIISVDIAKQVLQFNMMILLFNLLPIWPLDGGKFVQLFLSSRNPFIQSFRLSLQSSLLVLFILHSIILIYSPLNINVWLVLFYLDFILWFEWKQQRYVFMRFLLERHYGKYPSFSKLEPIEANGDEYVHEVLVKFMRGCKHLIYVNDHATSVGELDENELLHAYFTEKRIHAKVKELLYEN